MGYSGYYYLILEYMQPITCFRYCTFLPFYCCELSWIIYLYEKKKGQVRIEVCEMQPANYSNSEKHLIWEFIMRPSWCFSCILISSFKVSKAYTCITIGLHGTSLWQQRSAMLIGEWLVCIVNCISSYKLIQVYQGHFICRKHLSSNLFFLYVFGKGFRILSKFNFQQCSIRH